MEAPNLGLTTPYRSEIGMRIPLLAGAVGRDLLARLKDAEVDDILTGNKFRRFRPNSCVGKDKFKYRLFKNNSQKK